MHKVQELVRLHRCGTGAREVARLLGISPNTERDWRVQLTKAGLLDGDVHELPEMCVLDAAVPRKPPPQQTSSVSQYEARIRELTSRGAGAKAIYDRLRLDEPTFSGSYHAVRRLRKRLEQQQPPRAEDVVIPVVTIAGGIAQVDFGYAGMMYDTVTDKLRRSWVFVMTLSHSRHMFAKCVFRQDMETWQQLHVEAFTFFGGVPGVVVPDNLKAAVIRASFGVDDGPQLNRSYVEVARHFDFKVDPTPPRSPTLKGKVERDVQYVKRNALATMAEEITIEEANADLLRWTRQIAGQRRHGATGRAPMEMFEAEERAALKALPTHPYVPVTWKQAKVHRDSHIMFKRRLYSAPWLHIGKQVWVRATPTTLYIYADNERVAEHTRKDGGGRSTRDAHLPEFRRDLRYRGREWWQSRAAAIGPHTEALVIDMYENEDVASPLRRVQSIIVHLETFPRSRAENAAERAKFYGIHEYRGVRDILRKGLENEPLPGALPFAKDQNQYRFTRPVAEMLGTKPRNNNEYH